MHKYILSKQSEQDISEVVKYIREDSLPSAMTMSRAIQRTCALIGSMPRIGRIASDISSNELYYFPIEKFNNYLIFYILTDGIPLMVRILHARRDIPTIMKKWYE